MLEILGKSLYAVHLILIFTLSYYLLTALQWYSYRFKRVILNFSKPMWHFYFFIAPAISYYGIIALEHTKEFLTFFSMFMLYIFVIYLPMLFFWYKKQDKPLVFTSRVKKFFGILLLVTLFFELLFWGEMIYAPVVLMSIIVAFLLSFIYEKMLFSGFYKQALQKIAKNKDLKIITITASYGKTSIKNFLYEILKDDFTCYKTPRSVNTLSGLVLDINTALPNDTQIYISEAGARERGDIDEIARFLNPQIAVVGEIGAQHIEYFKSLENIRNTKMELLNSNRLEKSYIHVSANVNPDHKATIFGDNIKNIKASIDGTYFTLNINGKDEEFYTPILGEFNAANLSVCILIAIELGLDIQDIKQKISYLKSVEHRLQRLDAGGKIIIDDSFNGNFNGMSSSYELVSSYEGRKVLITPGIVESTKEDNEKLALKANDIFDIVIITGKLNSQILANKLKKPEVLFLDTKANMQKLLGEVTQKGDLILFSNDAPKFI